MRDVALCPACGRRGSMRFGALHDEPFGVYEMCPAPFHSQADLAPQLAETLRDLADAVRKEFGSGTAHSIRTQACLAEARALLPGEKEVTP